jgi:phosphoglycerate dehydrogenase-like enzyme
LSTFSNPLNLLVSARCAEALTPRLEQVLGACGYQVVDVAGDAAEVAFISRDVTGLSTKHQILPETQSFYDAMLRSERLRWVHTHSAGADRDIFKQLQARGVEVTTSAGANARVVAQTALAGLLALARHFPRMWQAQQARSWQPLLGSGLPADLDGQRVTLVGQGPIGQTLTLWLQALGLEVQAVSRQAREGCLSYEQLPQALATCDWLILACPLSPLTHQLIDAQALARLPPGARVINVARGEVIDETALLHALQSGQVGGAYLDVFSHEPLADTSPFWNLPNVIVTPHSAGFSAGNEARVTQLFLQRLQHYLAHR